MIILRRSMLVLVLFAALAQGSEPAENRPSPEVLAELTSLVKTWIDAEVVDDRQALERIFHDEFLSTFASGATLDKTAYIDIILALDIAPFKVRNEATRIFGDTAVVIDVTEDGATKFTWIAFGAVESHCPDVHERQAIVRSVREPVTPVAGYKNV